VNPWFPVGPLLASAGCGYGVWAEPAAGDVVPVATAPSQTRVPRVPLGRASRPSA
jgi:hypothetical protein